jgi:hypothetical protein
VNKIATLLKSQALGISMGEFTSLLPRLPLENEEIAREFDLRTGSR